jgi:stress response protein YsnF
MDLKHTLRNGMQVVGLDDRPYGTVERYDDGAVYVQGRRVPLAAIERAEHDRLYLDTPDLWGLSRSDTADAGPGSGVRAVGSDGGGRAASRDGEEQDAGLGGEIRVPLLEEQLAFGTRTVDLGEIQIHKSVEETEEVRSGQLNREDVQVERVRVDRRVTEPEASRQEGEWLVIPIMEEVFVVEKHLMVTEEIRIRKRLVTEESEVRDTVRRERATVEDRRVPRAPLLTEPVMPKADADRAREREAPAANEAAARGARGEKDDSAWDRLHREIRDA